jgi:hypothetical protein
MRFHWEMAGAMVCSMHAGSGHEANELPVDAHHYVDYVHY